MDRACYAQDSSCEVETCVPETPTKCGDESESICDEHKTYSLRPEFAILLNVSAYDQGLKSEGAVRDLSSMFEKSRPALFSLSNNKIRDNEKNIKKTEAPKLKRPAKNKSGVTHGIKKPRMSNHSTPLSDLMKEILAKKKAFSVSTGSDQEIVKIQNDVSSLLDHLEESTSQDNKEEMQLQKIDSLIQLAQDCASESVLPEHQVSNNELLEKEMDKLIDKILGDDVTSCSIISSSANSESATQGSESIIGDAQLLQLEGILSGMNNSQEEDLFADEEDSLESHEKKNTEIKLFPVFIKGATPAINLDDSLGSSSKSSIILPFRDSGDKEQMILDAGQKKYGQVECPECQCVYDPDDRADVTHHMQYHNRHNTSIKHLGWKNERVVTKFPDGARVIVISKGDPSPWWRRVQEIMISVDHDLGFAKEDVSCIKDNNMVFFYIQNKQLLGCLVAEEITEANKMLDATESLCSEETFPVLCGISRIWTAASARKQGIATKLVNSMRENFLSYKTLDLNEIAFSSPSLSGREFATKYTKTPCFFVYQ